MDATKVPNITCFAVKAPLSYLLEALLGVDAGDLMRAYEATALYFGGVEAEQVADFVATQKTYNGTHSIVLAI